MLAHVQQTHRLAAGCFLVLLLIASTTASAQRGQRGDKNDRSKTEVTAEKVTAIEHYMGVISVLEGKQVGPVIGGKIGRVVCEDCGPFPEVDIPDCNDLRDKVNEAAQANADAQKLLDMVQSLLEAYYEWQFWGGVGDMVADMVTAAVSVASAGTAGGAAAAAADILIEMGADAATGALQEAVADALGIDLSGETAMQDAVSMFNEERKRTNQAFQDALKAWQACLAKKDAAENLSSTAIADWSRCWETRQCWIEY